MQCHYCDDAATVAAESDGIKVGLCDAHFQDRLEEQFETQVEQTEQFQEQLEEQAEQFQAQLDEQARELQA